MKNEKSKIRQEESQLTAARQLSEAEMLELTGGIRKFNGFVYQGSSTCRFCGGDNID